MSLTIGVEVASVTGAPTSGLAVMRQYAVARSTVDAVLIEGALEVVRETSERLLAEKGYADVGQLTPAQQNALRSETKALASAEIQTSLGVGVTEARAFVGVATSPPPVRSEVLGSLSRGEVSWHLVRGFWRRCGALPVEQAVLVADGLFGTDPAQVCVERLAPDGSLRAEPWHHADYWAALEREAVRAQGEDVAAERERRRAAYAARRASMVVHEDGTATFAVTGPLTSLAGVAARVDRAARTLRREGDERTLDQLRADVAAALLLHGELPLPELRREPEASRARSVGQEATEPPDQKVAPGLAVTQAELDRILQVVHALPPIALQVVVPHHALTGAGDRGPGVRPVAEVLGPHSAFLAPGHARELALLPGTTLVRLLTDPADGRLVERSLTTYRPDTDMRRQVMAADVRSRAPGSRVPAASCDLDHVQAWAAGGVTSASNLSALDRTRHVLKTNDRWRCAITPGRDLHWTTFLGHRTSTRPHDYRQYVGAEPCAGSEAPPGTEPAHADSSAARPHPQTPDEANQALLDLLVRRGPSALLKAEDDVPQDGIGDWVWVPHHAPRRRGGDRAEPARGRGRGEPTRSHPAGPEEPPPF